MTSESKCCKSQHKGWNECMKRCDNMPRWKGGEKEKRRNDIEEEKKKTKHEARKGKGLRIVLLITMALTTRLTCLLRMCREQRNVDFTSFPFLLWADDSSANPRNRNRPALVLRIRMASIANWVMGARRARGGRATLGELAKPVLFRSVSRNAWKKT